MENRGTVEGKMRGGESNSGKEGVKEGRAQEQGGGFGERGEMMLMFAYYSSSNFPPGAH